MKYLRNLRNHNDYTTFIAGADFAEIQTEKNAVVSYCRAEEHVHYNPYVDPYAGHEYVEIGGLKWATMNIGADSVTDTGLYFQWGDTQGYTAAQVGSDKTFNWENYKYTNDGGSTFTKYNSTDTILDLSDDAAQTAWGGNWRMPTKEDFTALSAAVNTQWVTNYQGSGVNGRLMTDKTDSSKKLFFPAAGICDNSMVRHVGSGGYYWSSSLDPSNVAQGSSLYFNSSSVYWQSMYGRNFGFAVRGVVS